jgi:hypothetical protein
LRSITTASSVLASTAFRISMGRAAVMMRYPSSLRSSRSASMTAGWSSAIRICEGDKLGTGNGNRERLTASLVMVDAPARRG